MLVIDAPSSRIQSSRRKRQCGAWALSWVYRMLGIHVDVQALWENLATLDRFGSEAVASHSIARDAIHRGLDSATLSARNPWALLHRSSGICEGVIVCHRLREGAPLGHFSVVEEVSDRTIRLRDQDYGLRTFSKNQFLDSWMNARAEDEFSRGIMVAISKPDNSRRSTRSIHTMHCKRCDGVIPLEPYKLFFDQRDWEAFFCPYCDAAHG